MKTKMTFNPMLAIPDGVTDVSFYTRALGARELRRWSNDDDSIHVVEFALDEVLFHLHQENRDTKMLSPETAGISTVTIGLMVDDVLAVVSQAVAAGAIITSPVQDYDYGYRQATIVDPFGHRWQIQTTI